MFSKVDLVKYKMDNYQPLTQEDYDTLKEYAKYGGEEGQKARDAFKSQAMSGFPSFQHIGNRDKFSEDLFSR